MEGCHGEDIWKDVKFTRSIRFRVGLVFQYPEYQLFEETVYRDIAFGPKNMIYRWLSSSQYLPLCTVSNGATYLAAVAMGQSNGIFQSSINVFRTNSGDVYKTIPIGNDLIYDLEFVDSTTLLAVGESGAWWYTADGSETGSYDYDGSYLKDFDLGGDGFLTLSLNMYKAGNRYSVVTVGPDGGELGNLYVGEEILDLSAAGHYVAVLTASKLTIYDETMRLSFNNLRTKKARTFLTAFAGSIGIIGIALILALSTGVDNYISDIQKDTMNHLVDRYFDKLRGKKLLVLGIGVSNRPLIRMLLGRGFYVTACDKTPREKLEPEVLELEREGARLHVGEGYLDGLSADVVFRTPGMHPNIPELVRLREQGAKITSEMEVFFEVCPCPIIGVTGSDGKTTTTTLIAKILEHAGRRVFVGGNIGSPLLPQAESMD